MSTPSQIKFPISDALAKDFTWSALGKLVVDVTLNAAAAKRLLQMVEDFFWKEPIHNWLFNVVLSEVTAEMWKAPGEIWTFVKWL